MNEFFQMDRLIDELKKEITLYQELFGEKSSVEQLNKSFGEAFSVFQRSMFFEIVCRISAMFDPAQTGKEKNLTLDHLMSVCGGKITKDLYLEAEGLKWDFAQTGIKAARNKLYAHYDLKIYTGKKKLASNISYEVIWKLLEDLSTLVRSLGEMSGQMPISQVRHRKTKLPKKRNGSALVARISNT
ncbi:AbiU2 domain-containing protein [Marinobacter mobilis]|uniref:AbiU2 domain-containing protein n=1 Tax=Marinobacter mobilis TaxID=488533 RepID=UPI0035C76359